MSKNGLFGVSLVAAIPGGILTALLVMTFLDNADKLTGMLWAISVPTLLTSVLVTLLPVGVLLFGPKSDAADTDDDVAVDDDDALAADTDSGDDIDAFGDDEEEDLVAGEGDELTMDGEDDFDDDGADTLDGDSEDLFMEDDDDFGLEMDEDDDK